MGGGGGSVVVIIIVAPHPQKKPKWGYLKCLLPKET